jgi:ABC-2 type transport system permease protein
MMMLHVARRELLQYLQSPFAYLVSAAFLFIVGVFFALILDNFVHLTSQGPMFGQEGLSVGQGVIEPFSSTLGLVLVLFLPTLTMRVLSEEQRTGSIALLLSSPISSLEIVLGKWLGLMAFLLLLMGLGLSYVPAVLIFFGNVAIAPMLSAALGIVLLTAAGSAIGVMTSSFSGRQIIAAVLAWLLLLGSWILSFLESLEGILGQVGRSIGLILHYESFGQALIRSNDLLYFTLITAFCLFVAQQRVESHRWS